MTDFFTFCLNKFYSYQRGEQFLCQLFPLMNNSYLCSACWTFDIKRLQGNSIDLGNNLFSLNRVVFLKQLSLLDVLTNYNRTAKFIVSTENPKEKERA